MLIIIITCWYCHHLQSIQPWCMFTYHAWISSLSNPIVSNTTPDTGSDRTRLSGYFRDRLPANARDCSWFGGAGSPGLAPGVISFGDEMRPVIAGDRTPGDWWRRRSPGHPPTPGHTTDIWFARLGTGMMDRQKVHSEAAPVRTGREARSWLGDNSDVRVFEARDPNNGFCLKKR